MGNIQKERIDAHVHSLDLDRDLHEILHRHGTKEEIDDIKDRVQGIV